MNPIREANSRQVTLHPHTLESPQGGATATIADESFTAAMEYAVVLDEKANTQDKHINEIEARADGKTVLTHTMDYTARVVSTGASKELTKIQATMNQLEASVTATPEIVATLSNIINGLTL